MRVYLYHTEGSPYCLSVNAFNSDWRTLRTSLKCVSEGSALHVWGTLGHTSSRSENCAWGVWDITDYEDESSNQRIFNSTFVFPQYTEFEENNIFCWNTADFNDLPRQFWAKHQRQPKSNRLRNVAASALDVNCLSFFFWGSIPCLRNILSFCQYQYVLLPWILWQLPLWYPERETDNSLWAFALSFSSGGIKPWTCIVQKLPTVTKNMWIG